MALQNPYYNIVGISNSELFFNRKTDIEQILNFLLSPDAQCISIVGQRKIGKTSLARHLAHPTTLEQFGFIGKNCLFTFIDCQRDPQALKSREVFYRLLLHRLCAEITYTLPDFVRDNSVNSVNPYSWHEEWNRVLQKLRDRKFYVIVIFDEFDKAISEENLHKEGLFGSLRGFAQEFWNFAWITCTRRPLQVLFREAFDSYRTPEITRTSESEFYNIVPGYHVVWLFKPKDILPLITTPAQAKGIDFSLEERQAIIRFGGNFPFFIQRACYHFFAARLRGTVDHEEVLLQCIKEGQQFWDNYWRNLSARQQKLLFSIADGRSPGATSDELENLKNTALIYEEGGRWHPFSEEFGRFVLLRDYPFADFTIAVGQLLGNQYEVLKKVGHTAHSEVVKAWDKALQRDVAIKLLHADARQKSEVAERLSNNLLREGFIVAKLEHKNIGKVYTAILEPPAIIMQWIEGQSLYEKFAEDTPLSIANVVKIGIGIAMALDYIHSQEITHRDIKPHNIILNEDGEPMLIDFDIARSKNHATITGHKDGSSDYVGTKEYSAPEQFKCPEAVGPEADIFALGVVLYEALTHHPPYRYGNNPEHYNDQLPGPEQHDIPAPLYRILCGLLHQEPKQRPNALQVRNELQAYLATLGVNYKDE